MDNDLPPPVPTPPAYVIQLERRQHEQQKEIDELKSIQGADLLAINHLLGRISTQMSELFEYVKRKLP